ncbi:MAG: NFACT family protein [Oscillospiraceae bacterium]|nr:NFACT family protein [Oscillospiraceae bacterium]
MPPNAEMIGKIKDELSEQILGLAAVKIQQPLRNTVVLSFRGKSSKTHRLLICADTGVQRLHLTQYQFDNPEHPPVFCMLLRKHLNGARLDDIFQPPNERVIELIFRAKTPLGDITVKKLVVELFGHLPNIILLDEYGIIIDSLRKISGDFKSDCGEGGHGTKRMILPGLKYEMPEPNRQREAAGTAGAMGEKEKIFAKTDEMAKNISISEMLEGMYTQKSKNDNMRLASLTLTKAMKTAQKRINRRLEAQISELGDADDRDFYRQCGDLILSNLKSIKKGDAVLYAKDYFSSDAIREIALDAQKSPQANADKYYKAYAKLRNAEKRLTEQIKIGEKELEYVQSVVEQIKRAENEKDLDEIRHELEQTKYLKAGNAGRHYQSKKKKIKQPEASPLRFASTSGVTILVGKNNTQNDMLTLKVASRFDIWLHAQKIHGAHVIIKCGGTEPDEKTLYEAAALAVYYSAARGGTKVSVDYTPVRFVKKPPGAHPGMVVYTQFKTLTVDSDEELIGRFKV